MTLINSHNLERAKAIFDHYTPIAMLFSEDMTLALQQG